MLAAAATAAPGYLQSAPHGSSSSYSSSSYHSVAPSVQLVQSAPQYVHAAPSVQVVHAAPAVQVVQAAPQYVHAVQAPQLIQKTLVPAATSYSEITSTRVQHPAPQVKDNTLWNNNDIICWLSIW